MGRQNSNALQRRRIEYSAHQLRAHTLTREESRYKEMIDVAAWLKIRVSDGLSIMLHHERRNSAHAISPKCGIDKFWRPCVYLFGCVVSSGDAVYR